MSKCKNKTYFNKIKGDEFSNWLASYIYFNFSDRGITVYREVFMGKSIIGKRRKVDVLVINKQTNKMIVFECKTQSELGTADEKIPYALSDLEAMEIPAYLAYTGNGFSSGISHLLSAHQLTCHIKPAINYFNRDSDTEELDHILAMNFSWYDVFVMNSKPYEPSLLSF